MQKLIKKIPHVAIYLSLHIKTNRELLQGFLQYARLHGPWSIRIYETPDAINIDEQPFTGAFGTFAGSSILRRFSSKRIPMVITDPMNMSRPPRAKSFTIVACDNVPIGEAAADYFLSRGYTNFAYIGNESRSRWSEERGAAFMRHLATNGKGCMTHSSPADGELTHFLASLPRPAAVFAANDTRGSHVLDACRAAGISVPSDIAVLSCDNDELICETTTPPLSSIQFSTERAGSLAAEALDRLMHGNIVSPSPILYGFSSIVTRYSSESLLIPDRLVERALTYIRLNAMTRLHIPTLVSELHVSRRLLEKRFHNVTGRTIHAEITRMRLERARTLLIESSLGIETIAEECCFPSASHMGVVFKKHFGMTPSNYRRGAAFTNIRLKTTPV